MAAWNPEANDLFLKALDLRSPGKRRAYIDEACRGNAELRAQVESLLSASERAGSFLEKPVVDLAAGADPLTGRFADEVCHADQPTANALSQPFTEGSGTRLGSYKLLQQIGEGGMGIVYMAEQERPVRRRVALKIIKPG